MHSSQNTGMCSERPSACIRSGGFTLIELLMVLAAGLILLAIAVPEFSAVVQKNRIRATSSDLHASLNLARNEAIRRKHPVQVCPSGNGSYCDPNGDWNDGWIVVVTASGRVIRTFDAPGPGLHMQADNQVADFVRFNPTGDALGTVGEIRICHDTISVRSRAVRVAALGRIESADRTRTDCSPGA